MKFGMDKKDNTGKPPNVPMMLKAIDTRHQMLCKLWSNIYIIETVKEQLSSVRYMSMSSFIRQGLYYISSTGESRGPVNTDRHSLALTT